MATIIEDLAIKLGFQIDKKSVSEADKVVGWIKKTIGAIALYKAGQGLLDLIKTTADIGDKADETAQKLGISAEAVQELGYAAGFSSISGDELTASMGKLAVNLQQVKDKGGAAGAADSLRKLHISAKDLKGESLDQNLELIADRISKMPDGIAKTAIAVDLFGKSGKDMIPFLNEGQAGIVKLRNEAQELGIVISNDATKQFAKLNDEQDKLKAQLGGVRNQIVTALLPTVMEIVTSMRAWLAENKELIASGIKTAVEVLAAVIRGVGTALEFVISIVQFLNDNSELTESIILALAAAFLVMGVNAAIAWIAALGPTVPIIAAVALVIYGIRMLIKHWAEVKGAFQKTWDWILDKLTRSWNFIKAVGNRIKDFFVKDIPDAIKGAWDDMWDSIVDGAKELRNLPVIKQLLDLVGVGGTEAPKSPTDVGYKKPSTASGYQASIAAPSRTGDVASNAPTSIRGGDINVTVNGGTGDPSQVAAMVKTHVAEQMDTWLTQTHEVVG